MRTAQFSIIDEQADAASARESCAYGASVTLIDLPKPRLDSSAEGTVIPVNGDVPDEALLSRDVVTTYWCS